MGSSRIGDVPVVPITRFGDYPITQLLTALGHPGDVALERQLAEAQTAQAEFPHVSTRPAAQVASVAQTDLELRFLRFLRNFGCSRHFVILVVLGPSTL